MTNELKLLIKINDNICAIGREFNFIGLGIILILLLILFLG